METYNIKSILEYTCILYKENILKLEFNGIGVSASPERCFPNEEWSNGKTSPTFTYCFIHLEVATLDLIMLERYVEPIELN